MEKGFTVKNEDAAGKPVIIIVSNYEPENRVVNWGFSDEEHLGNTRSDIGAWKIKYKSHAKVA